MKILFLTSRFPYPPIGGDRSRILNFIKQLSRRHEISLLAMSEADVEPAHLAHMRPYLRRCEVVTLSRPACYMRAACGVFSPKPLQVHYYRSAAFRKKLAELAQATEFDLVYTHLIRMAEYGAGIRGAAKILDLADALGLSYERNCRLTKPLSPYTLAQHIERKRVRAFEKQMLPQFDQSLIISPVDRNYISKYAAVDTLRIVGIGVDLDYFYFQNGGYAKNAIVFFGKMSTTPNQDAALYFVREILPRVQQEVRDAKLTIVGSNPGPAVRRLAQRPQIDVTGEVTDIRPYLHRAALSVCPMRTGAGVKGKIIESMAVGTPVVATPLGAAGLHAAAGRDLLLANDPAAFAAQVVRVLASARLRQRLAANARKLVESSYAWEKIAGDLEALFRAPAPGQAAKPESLLVS